MLGKYLKRHKWLIARIARVCEWAVVWSSVGQADSYKGSIFDCCLLTAVLVYTVAREIKNRVSKNLILSRICLIAKCTDASSYLNIYMTY